MGRRPPAVQGRIQLLDGQRILQVALVILNDQRQFVDVQVVFAQVFLQVLYRFDVFLDHVRVAVGHEDDAVGSLQHQLARGVVEHLARDGIKHELGGHARDLPQVQRQIIEIQRAVGFRCNGDQLAGRVFRRFGVDDFKIGRFAAAARPVVDQLAGHCAGGKVNLHL